MKFDLKKSIIEIIELSFKNNNSKMIEKLIILQNELENIGDSGFASEISNIRSRYNNISKSSKSSKNKEFILPDLLEKYLMLIFKENKTAKLLFYGKPGTGKTETAYWIARKLSKNFVKINLDEIMSSYMGDSIKNLKRTMLELPSNTVVFFDEIDSLIIDRFKDEDLGEIKRTTIAMLNALDEINDGIIFLAATNRIGNLDPAFLRRMDDVIDIEKFYNINDYIKIININKTNNEDLDNLLEKLILNSDNKNPAQINKIYRQSKILSSEGMLLSNKICDWFGFEDIRKMSEYLKKELGISYSHQSKIFGMDYQKFTREIRESK